jgi:hypothetical protein
MYDSPMHVFTNEFDDLLVLISLDFDTSSASMDVRISNPEGVWVEQVMVSLDQLTAASLE